MLTALMIDASLKGAVVLALAALLSLALRRRSAATRHALWTAAVVSQLLLPVLLFWGPRWRVPLPANWMPSVTLSSRANPANGSGPLSASAGAGRPGVSPTQPTLPAPSGSQADSARAAQQATRAPNATDSPRRGALMRPVGPTQWLGIVWVLGALAVLGRLVAGTIAVSRLASRGERVADGEWLSLAQRLANALGIRRPLTLLRGDRLAVPVTWGVVYPIVLLPDDAATWPEERRRYVLVHEMAHVQRLDAFTQLVSQVALALFWFNPLMWLAVRRIRTEREHACDDIVLQHGTPPSRYASDLLEMVRNIGNPDRRQAQPAFAALAMARRSEFEGRMLSILDPRQNRGPLHRGGASMSALIMLCIILPLAALTPTSRAATASLPPARASAGSLAAHGQDSTRAAAITDPAASHRSPFAPAMANLQTSFDSATRVLAGAVRPTLDGDRCGKWPAARSASRHISMHTDDDGSSLLQYSITSASRCVHALIAGRPVFSIDARDIISIPPDGHATIHEVRGESDRRLTVTPDGSGALLRTYVENGVARSAADADAWLAVILPEIVRETAIDAKDRTARIRKAGGVDAVLAEIGRIQSTGAQRAYFEALLDEGRLSPEESEQVARQASKTLSGSSGDLRSVLARVPAAGRLGQSTRSALSDAIEGMGSSGDKAAILTQYGLTGDRELLLLALQAARTIESDGDLSNLLVTLAAPALIANDATLRTAYFAAQAAIESDGDARRVLEAAAPYGHQDAAVTLGVLEAATRIASDGDKSSVLVMVAGQRLLTTSALRNAYVTAARTIASDGDLRRALEAADATRTTIEQ